ncbi:phosphotransferase family protein [Streptomyces sp. MP131-18]|uniref:phosphotransferase family protein n=1 Tax=Streptomyces sp. MP131-18 TaxID=1857892 RepID=UPI00097BD547|nr:phosphotransferase family protein [Streptomyces sp. MP131-18]ONK15492.1 putative aminoglycoside phosphotransferase [Streptomyces sp. MP131-18]
MNAVRAEDAFDVARVDTWLKRQLPHLTGTPEVSQFTGGASNLTYLLRYPGAELVLRRPPAGHKAASAHDMAREHHVLQALAPAFPLVPAVRALCRDPAVIGCDFLVMDRVPGVVLRRDPPPGLALDTARARALSETYVDTLVELHRVEPTAPGLAELGRGEGYVRRQVEGWTRRYERARTPGSPDFAAVTSWLAAHRPADTGARVIHNDWRLDNLVLDADDLRVRGVLDWEMATIGDPLMDLGGALAYWTEAGDGPAALAARRQPSHLPGMYTRAQIVARYCARTGLRADHWPFYETFGRFRLAAIAQQITYRYHHGQTHNPAFRDLPAVVADLHRRCTAAVRAA